MFSVAIFVLRSVDVTQTDTQRIRHKPIYSTPVNSYISLNTMKERCFLFSALTLQGIHDSPRSIKHKIEKPLKQYLEHSPRFTIYTRRLSLRESCSFLRFM